MQQLHQRDALIEEITERAKRDPNIFFLSADFGAPALDDFRRELPNQFVHCGISEQNMIDVAAGLALDGRKVFAYAMAPFASLRCIEQHKCATGIMNLPVTTIVSGVGLGYSDAGPTHYATEDLACLRSLVGSHVVTASDAQVARLLAADSVERPRFLFIRLDRHPGPNLTPEGTMADVRNGFRVLRPGKNLCIVSQGHTLAAVIEAAGSAASDPAVVDLIQVKPFPEPLIEYLSRFQTLMTVEEQTPSGGLSSAVMEALADGGIVKRIHRVTLPERYFFENGGRSRLLNIAGLTTEPLSQRIAEAFRGA